MSRILRRGTCVGLIGRVGLSSLIALTTGVQGLQARNSSFSVDVGAGYRNNGDYFQTGEDEGQTSQALGNLFASYALRVARTQVFLQYTLLADRRLDDPQETSLSHRLGFRLASHLSQRSRVRITANARLSPEIFAPAENTGQAIVVTTRSDQLATLAGIQWDRDVGRRVGLDLALWHESFTFDDPEAADTQALRAEIGGRLGLTQRTSWYLRGGTQRNRLESQDLNALLASTGLRIRLGREVGPDELLWGFFAADKEIQLEVGGYQSDRPGDADRNETVTGFRGLAQYFQRAGRTRWNLGVRRDLRPGRGVDTTVEADTGFAGLSRTFGRRLTLGLFGSLSRQRELEEDTDLGEFTGVNATLDWVIVSRLGLSANHEWIKQTRGESIAIEDLSYTKWSIFLTLRLLSLGGAASTLFEDYPRRLG